MKNWAPEWASSWHTAALCGAHEDFSFPACIYYELQNALLARLIVYKHIYTGIYIPMKYVRNIKYVVWRFKYT